MDGLREALLNEAVLYANRKIMSDSYNCMAAFLHIGYAYIDMAIDTPNPFRFVYMGESRKSHRGGIDSMLTDKGNAKLIKQMAVYLNINEEQSGEFLQRTIIYTHCIASLITAEVLHAEKEQAYAMVTGFGTDLLSLMGIDIDISTL